MIADSALTSLRLVFKPLSESAVQVGEPSYLRAHHQSGFMREVDATTLGSKSQLLLYSQNFALLLDDMSRIELRYLDGQNNLVKPLKSSGETLEQTGKQNKLAKITRVIGSRDVEQNKWNELIVTDASSDSQMNEHIAGLTRIVLVTPDKIDLGFVGQPERHSKATLNDTFENNPRSELFVGGMPDALRQFDRHPNNKLEQAGSGLLGEKLANGFRGCIKELSINVRDYDFKSDFNGDTLDGFDIGEYRFSAISVAREPPMMNRRI